MKNPLRSPPWGSRSDTSIPSIRPSDAMRPNMPTNLLKTSTARSSRPRRGCPKPMNNARSAIRLLSVDDMANLSDARSRGKLRHPGSRVFSTPVPERRSPDGQGRLVRPPRSRAGARAGARGLPQAGAVACRAGAGDGGLVRAAHRPDDLWDLRRLRGPGGARGAPRRRGRAGPEREQPPLRAEPDDRAGGGSRVEVAVCAAALDRG